MSFDPTPYNDATGNDKGDQIVVGRVYYTLLDDDVNKVKEMKVSQGSIGAIQCRIVSNGYVDETSEFLIAYPLDSNIKKFPLVNELVTILPSQTYTAVDGKSNLLVTYYYMGVVGVWDSPEHNSLPDNSFFDRSNDNVPDTKSYKNASIGVPKKATSTSESNPVTGKSFKEKGNVKKLKHLPGDVIIEGRTGNSIRFGSSNTTIKDAPWKGPDGSPLMIIRNNPRKTGGNSWDSIYEDINGDGSVLAVFSEQTIDFIPANDNFKSYHQEVPITTKHNIVKANTIIESPASVPPEVPADPIVPEIHPVLGQETKVVVSTTDNEINFIPDREDQYQYMKEFEDPIPLTNGLLRSPNFGNTTKKFDGGVESTSNSNKLESGAHVSKSDIKLIEEWAGGVTSSVPGMTKGGRALLDLIAVTEGTMGRGNMNGYDYVIGNHLIPGFTDINASNPKHPNVKIWIERIKDFSTAAGRYQFIYGKNWRDYGEKIYHLDGMSKYNQNFLAWQTITVKRHVSLSDIEKMGTDFDTFKRVIGGTMDNSVDRLSKEYASLPDVYHGNIGFYKQAGQYSFETLFIYYKKILTYYNAFH